MLKSQEEQLFTEASDEHHKAGKGEDEEVELYASPLFSWQLKEGSRLRPGPWKNAPCECFLLYLLLHLLILPTAVTLRLLQATLLAWLGFYLFLSENPTYLHLSNASTYA